MSKPFLLTEELLCQILNHNFVWFLGGRELQQGPGRSEVFLLPRPGPQVPCLFSHRPPLQDQAYLNRMM